ncbi:MAG: hypothetical protein Q7R86_01990 [bacterium]|nr:hypothetical protein [bacterium]
MIGTEWIYRLGKSLYSLKNPQFSHCDLVVPLGYGLFNRNELPSAAKKTLREAVQIALKYKVPIAWASANFFWPGGEEKENRLKVSEAKANGLIVMPIITKGITNSVTEAQSIRQAIIDAKIESQSKTIVVVADWPHARSARKIWRKVFPEAIIILVSINGKWNNKLNPIFFGRSELRWLFINIVRHLALIILGIKIVSLFRHPIRQ